MYICGRVSEYSTSKEGFRSRSVYTFAYVGSPHSIFSCACRTCQRQNRQFIIVYFLAFVRARLFAYVATHQQHVQVQPGTSRSRGRGSGRDLLEKVALHDAANGHAHLSGSAYTDAPASSYDPRSDSLAKTHAPPYAAHAKHTEHFSSRPHAATATMHREYTTATAITSNATTTNRGTNTTPTPPLPHHHHDQSASSISPSPFQANSAMPQEQRNIPLPGVSATYQLQPHMNATSGAPHMGQQHHLHHQQHPQQPTLVLPQQAHHTPSSVTPPTFPHPSPAVNILANAVGSAGSGSGGGAVRGAIQQVMSNPTARHHHLINTIGTPYTGSGHPSLAHTAARVTAHLTTHLTGSAQPPPPRSQVAPGIRQPPTHAQGTTSGMPITPAFTATVTAARNPPSQPTAAETSDGAADRELAFAQRRDMANKRLRNAIAARLSSA